MIVTSPFLVHFCWKRQHYADRLGTVDFKQLVGWLERFKQMHGISFKKVCGESKSVDSSSEAMTNWEQLLSNITD